MILVFTCRISQSTLLEGMDFDEEESEWTDELPYLHTNEFHMDDQIFVPQHAGNKEKGIRFRVCML